MHKKRRASFIALALSTFLLLFGWQQVQADTVTIDPRTVRVGVDEQATVQVTCTNCFDTSYYYSMANPAVASYSVVSEGYAGATITITGLSEGSTFFSVTVTTHGTPLTVQSDIIVTGGIDCPADAALEGAPQKKTKLEILRDFRDEVLANTPTGQEFIKLYYKHADELVDLMLSDRNLFFHTVSVLDDFMLTILSIVEGRTVAITPIDLAKIEVLTEWYAKEASPELQNDLSLIREGLQDGTLWEQLDIKIDLDDNVH